MAGKLAIQRWLVTADEDVPDKRPDWRFWRKLLLRLPVFTNRFFHTRRQCEYEVILGFWRFKGHSCPIHGNRMS